MSKESNIRVVLVIGDNPDEMMKRYDKNLKVEPYIKYRYLDADKIRKTAIKTISQMLDNADQINLNDFQKDYFKNQLKSINNMTPFEYYQTLTNGMYYDEDGNALSTENPDGKYNGYNIGGNFSYPLICEGEKEKYQCHANEVLWDKVNMREEAVNYFNTVWEIKKEGRKPEGEFEEKIAKDWEERDAYLSNFKTKDDLIVHNCAYWTYAVLNKDGWFSLDDGGGEKEWIENFMNRFISPLNDELITIYEFG
jgi:hypothetical protein